MIKAHNIDYRTDIMKLHENVSLGDLTASLSTPVFVAPFACVVNFIDTYSDTDNSHDSSQTLTITYRHRTTTSNTLGTHTAAISANSQIRITPSSHNSLTQGTIIELDLSATCQTLSQVIVKVTYSPLIHRENS